MYLKLPVLGKLDSRYIATYSFYLISAVCSPLHDKHFETDEKISCRIDDSITPFYTTIHRLVWWVDKECFESIFFFLVFLLEKTAFDLLIFFHFNVLQLRYFWWNFFLNNFFLHSGLLRLLFVDGRYIVTYFIMITHQQNVDIHFLMTHVLQFLYCFPRSSNQILLLNIVSFLFLQTFFSYQPDFSLFWPLNLILCLIYLLLANLFSSLWLFFVLFWMLWIMVTVLKLCHVPHASRITTWGTAFAEIFFVVSKVKVRSWSHPFLITNL